MEAVANEEKIPSIDREFLQEKGYVYEIIPENQTLLLVLRNFEFPPAYAPANSDLLILFPAGYPNAGLDMFRTNPDVKLINGQWPKAAEPHDNWNGKSWQAWSRHISWRVGRDSLRSFITAIKHELEKGV